MTVEINGTDGMTYDEWHAQEEDLLNATVLVATLMQRGGSFGIGMMYHAHDAFNEVERPFDERCRGLARKAVEKMREIEQRAQL